MSIKIKILLPMIVVAVVLTAALMASNILQFSNYVDTTIADRVNAAANVAADKLEMLKEQANAASLYIAEEHSIADAIEKGDRNALLSIAGQLQTDAGADFCTITDATGIVLARTHNHENFGDDLSQRDYVSYALSGKNLSAFTKGSDVVFSVRSGVPVLNSQGKLIGTVSAGFRLDNNAFVDSIKELLNCEVTVFLGDERLSTTIVKDDGTRATGTKAAENVSQTVLAGNTYSGQAQILNQNAFAQYSPILGSDNTVLGMLFVGRYMTEKTDTVWSFIQLGLIITVILLAIFIPMTLFIVKRISAPIKDMVQAADALAAGDTEISIQVNTKDEMSELATAFNRMIENTRKQTHTIETIANGDLTVDVEARSEKDMMNNALKMMLYNNNVVFSQIINSANQVSGGSQHIADSSQTLAQGAAQQSAAIEQLSNIFDEVNVNTQNNANMARQAAEDSNTIETKAKQGAEQMLHLLQAVKDINEASLSINKIIKAIDDIAFQTNILALNAAVEAARAGQHGKGFAVVAEEVRNLAAKSAEAAKDTGAIIQNSIAKAELGADLANSTSNSLSEIVSGIQESSRVIGEIADSSENQSVSIAQVNESIKQLSQVVQQNNATAEESAAASQEMSTQAHMLQSMVSSFKVNNNVAAAVHSATTLALPAQKQNYLPT